MSKRFLSLLMAMVLCFSMLPTATLAETSDTEAEKTQNIENDADVYTVGEYDILQEGDIINLYSGLPHEHPVCGEVCNHLDANGQPMHKDVEWTAISSFSDQYVDAGHYYLTDNVEVGLPLVPRGNVDLCLNGHTITNKQTTDVISVSADHTVTLCDCDTTGEGGKLYGDGADKAHGVYLNGGTLNLYGGTITAREYGVYVAQYNSTFNMYGGTITDSGTGRVYEGTQKQRNLRLQHDRRYHNRQRNRQRRRRRRVRGRRNFPNGR